MEGLRGCGATIGWLADPLCGPTTLSFLHFVPISKYMTCTSGTMLFVQNSLLVCLFPFKRDVLLMVLIMSNHDEITVNNNAELNSLKLSTLLCLEEISSFLLLWSGPSRASGVSRFSVIFSHSQILPGRSQAAFQA